MLARMSWKVGDRLTHGHNPDLGAGRVVAVEGRTLIVEFPGAASRLRLAVAAPHLRPLRLHPGQRVRRRGDGGEDRIQAVVDDGRLRLGSGRLAEVEEVWPIADDLLERLAAGRFDPVEDFAARLDALHLLALREARGLGSFLGGRIRLFPHQLHAAEKATAADPVRWLLADEVGLGKTVEACLILSRLLRTGRAERCLVVAPETLVVQWLGELWRKYHQVFVLLDDARLQDVARDHGPEFNPFDVHRRSVVALETLLAHPRLTRQAVASGIDLLVVDEAHRLRRPPAHPGNPAWRAIAPIAALGRHVILATAIPLDDDVHGFYRLLQLLRPDAFPEDESFAERLARREPLPPCTSATRRVDIGGLPPRCGRPVPLSAAEGWRHRLALVQAVREAPALHAPGRRQKADRVRRALASGLALRASLSGAEAPLAALADRADAQDPRLAWLAQEAPVWRDAGEKTLVFVAHLETLDLVRDSLSRRAQLATAAFHERLSPARRDIEVAQFRLPSGPSLLVSTECGGEGRNFEFCRRLVLFDLPWNPLQVEQRIGRLDRIGREQPVEILYFPPPEGIGRDVALLHEALGVFRQPVAGLEPELARVEAAIELAALSPPGRLAADRFDALVAGARRAQSRIREAACHELHREPYQANLADGILARVPPDLDALNEAVVSAVCESLQFQVEEHSSDAWSFELGNAALVDSLPGVPGGTSYLGTFARTRALEDERLDFFAAGHPLVEGVLAHLEEAAIGRVAIFGVSLSGGAGLGLLALYKDGPVFEAVCVDAAGRPRPDWAHHLSRRPLRTRRIQRSPANAPGWPKVVQRMAHGLDPLRSPVALAALLIAP